MEMVAVGCSDRLEMVCPALKHQRTRAILAQALQVQENWDSEEALQYCNLYDMCGYDKYVRLGFENVLDSLAAGRDMQISEDDSLED
jgi:hypothetical protein